jgi:hypothetical protein
MRRSTSAGPATLSHNLMRLDGVAMILIGMVTLKLAPA